MKYVETKNKEFFELITNRTIDYYNECTIGEEKLVFADFFYDKTFQAYVFTVKLNDVDQEKIYSFEDASVA